MSDAVGKTCPYCQTPIKPGENVVYCSSCSIPHHQQCWNESQGCTTFGCSGQPSLTPRQATTGGVVDINVESGAYGTRVPRFCPFCGQPTRTTDIHCSQCGRNLRLDEMAAVIDMSTQAIPGPMPNYSTGAAAVYPKASVWTRLGASIVDGLVAFAACLPFYIGVCGETDVLIILGLIGLVWAIWYGFTKDGRGNGQSIGKKATGLMVVNLNTGLPCTKGTSALRALLWYIPYLNGFISLVDCIMVLATKDGRRIGDHLAGTQVIAVETYNMPG